MISYPTSLIRPLRVTRPPASHRNSGGPFLFGDDMNEEQIKRIRAGVDVRGPDECWEWLRCRDKYGYGQTSVSKTKLGAHRVIWEITNGPIPPGMCVLHACDNSPCCNPGHLFLGTHADNMKDMAKKGRGRGARGEENHNAKLTDEIVLEIRRLYKAGGITQGKIAGKYGVSLPRIHYIVRRKTWRHI